MCELLALKQSLIVKLIKTFIRKMCYKTFEIYTLPIRQSVSFAEVLCYKSELATHTYAVK